ncbi:redoxin domain-containing protein [Fibrella aquatica]|uniref:redoxin domain-containing protein n=1 Tax=Fibrella aquatica TaxID=3242487 RepID=UPI003520EA50
MKNLGLSLACALLPLAGFAQSGSYTLTGKVGPSTATAKAYLRTVAAGAVKLDSADIKDGAFTFTGTVADPAKAMLLIDQRGVGMRKLGAAQGVTFYLEPGTISIASPDSALHAVVSGTKLNADNEKLKMAMKPATDNMAALMAEYQKASVEQRKSPEFGQAIEKRYNEIESEQRQILSQFIKATPASLVSLDAIKSVGGSVPEYTDIAPLFASLSPEVKATKAGVEYAASLAKLKATAIGEIAPAFTQADTLGNPVALSDFKGKYVLVDFWASWCGPCRQENPNVVKNFQQFKDKNFTVLGVSLDRPNAKEAWMKAIHKDELTWTQVSDLKFWDNDVAKLYGVRAIPQNFLIGPDGRILAKNIRGEELGKKLGELLQSK